MLFHASIPADDPERAARVIGELWGGDVMPFPPFPEAYITMANDQRRTALEVYPRGREHLPAPREYAIRTNPVPSPHSEVHLAIGTVLSAEAVLACAQREGWLAQRSSRGGLFDVIEFWVENKFLLEVLPKAEQQRYVENLSAENFRVRFGLEKEKR
jgi:hypothetical protein